MSYKNVSIGVGALLVSYLIMTIPVVMAADVNILFAGETRATTEISSDNLINSQITIKHDPADITWTQVSAMVSVSSASLAKSISKILLYKCKNTNPVDCVKTEPLEFETYIDTELAWDDISEVTGEGFYPQAANLMLLVKLEGDGQPAWAGMWQRIERTQYNVFNTYSYELSRLDLEADSVDLVTPIKDFIDNYQMVPFSWVSKATFVGANVMHSIGGNKEEMETKTFQTAQPSVNFVDSIAKDYFFVFPETTSGVTNAITLNKNPSFDCGNNLCESDLGETSDNCCFDCACPEGSYCDMTNPEDPETGTCRQEGSISLDVLPVSPPSLSDCTQPFDLEVRTRVLGAPSGLESQVAGVVTIDEVPHTVTCDLVGNVYTCPLTLNSEVGCGVGSYQLGPNTLTLTLNYYDGANFVTKDFTQDFSSVPVNYECGCTEGYYCDAGTNQCRTEASITLSILSINSFISDYDETGDTIDVQAKINNPPGDLDVVASTYNLGNITVTGGGYIPGASGTVTCDVGEDYTYNCSIPFSIPDYDHTNQYVIRNNELTFDVTFSSAGETKTKALTTAFSDITIPSYRCGDGVQNPEETSENCCHDAGCPSEDQFCDIEKGCQYYDDFRIVIDTVSPDEMDSCRMQHPVSITGRIQKLPSDATLDYYYFLEDGSIFGQLNCRHPDSHTGQFNCTLLVPELECPTSDPVQIGPNTLNFTISYPNGPNIESRTLTTENIPNLYVTPTYVCGQFGCETEYGESASNCCLDCPCEESVSYGTDYYCDYNQDTGDNRCLELQNITLELISPTEEVNYDSCEVRNRLNVRARIVNPASGLTLDAQNVVINGSNAKNVRCRQIEQMGENYYNCTVSVPTVWNCQSGSTYIYEPNSISLLVSHNNGQQQTTQILTTPLPRIVTTQRIETIFDIMDDFKDFMEETIQDLTDEIEKSADDIEKCIDELIAWAEAGIVLSIGLSFIGGTSGYADKLTASVTLLKVMLDTLAKKCDWMQKKHDLEVKKLEAQIQIKQMRVCIDMIQHQMDIGQCTGKEMDCFTRMVSCTDDGMDAMGDMMGTMNNIADDLVNDVDDLTNNWIEGINDIDEAFTHDTGSISVTCGGSSNCCGYTPKIDTSSTVNFWQRNDRFEASTVNVQITPPECDDWYWTLGGERKGQQKGNIGKAISVFSGGAGVYEVKVFCEGQSDPVQTTHVCYCPGTDLAGCFEEGTKEISSDCNAVWGNSRCTGAKPTLGPETRGASNGGLEITLELKDKRIESDGETTFTVTVKNNLDKSLVGEDLILHLYREKDPESMEGISIPVYDNNGEEQPNIKLGDLREESLDPGEETKGIFTVKAKDLKEGTNTLYILDSENKGNSDEHTLTVGSGTTGNQPPTITHISIEDENGNTPTSQNQKFILEKNKRYTISILAEDDNGINKIDLKRGQYLTDTSYTCFENGNEKSCAVLTNEKSKKFTFKTAFTTETNEADTDIELEIGDEDGDSDSLLYPFNIKTATG